MLARRAHGTCQSLWKAEVAERKGHKGGRRVRAARQDRQEDRTGGQRQDRSVTVLSMCNVLLFMLFLCYPCSCMRLGETVGADEPTVVRRVGSRAAGGGKRERQGTFGAWHCDECGSAVVVGCAVARLFCRACAVIRPVCARSAGGWGAGHSPTPWGQCPGAPHATTPPPERPPLTSGSPRRTDHHRQPCHPTAPHQEHGTDGASFGA
jgi:hypothetical protein